MYTSAINDKECKHTGGALAGRRPGAASGISGSYGADPENAGRKEKQRSAAAWLPETKKQRSAAAGRIAVNYAAACAVCAVIGLIYEIFSHGVWSTYMVLAWVFPFILGALPNFLIWLTRAKEPGVAAENIYACGVLTLTAGCMLKGVLEIFGTTNSLLAVFPIAATALLIAGTVMYILRPEKKG